MRLISALVGLGVVATGACGDNVLVLSSGLPDLDDAVKLALQAHGHTATVGPQYFNFDGSLNLGAFDTVYLQTNANWAVGDMPVAGQTQLVNYIKAGGGLVASEWTTWKSGTQGTLQVLGSVLPVTFGGFVTTAETTYSQAAPDADLNAGLPNSFAFVQTSFSGTETTLVAKQDAIVYYTSSTAVTGVVGWGVDQGRVLDISSVAGHAAVNDDEFGRLLANAMHWAGKGALCVADCNGNGSLNILDFVCFQQKFQAGDPSADINGDGNLNILDFVAFQQKFQQGC